MILKDIQDVQKAVAEFEIAKQLFDKLQTTPVADFIHDGQKRVALSEAQDLFKLAAEHQATIKLAIAELLDPKTAVSETERLLAQAQDHNTEMGKYVAEVQALVGTEFEAVTEALIAAKVK